jgi:hypothetical protein
MKKRIFLLLIVLFSFLIFSFPVDVKADISSVSILDPITGKPAYSQPSGVVDVEFEVDSTTTVSFLCDLTLYDVSFNVAATGDCTQTFSAGTHTYTSSINVGANPQRSYHLGIEIDGRTDMENNSVIIDDTPPVITTISPNLGTISVPTASGTSATDNYSSTLTYLWQKVSGPGNIIFSNNKTANPLISADKNGAYEAMIGVADDAGNISTGSVFFTWQSPLPAPEIRTPEAGSFIAGNDDYRIE